MVSPRPLPSIQEASIAPLQDVTNSIKSPRNARRLSPPRPLPSVPQSPSPKGLCCKVCKTSVTTRDALAMCPDGREFRGFSGKASLFREVHNIKLSPPKKMLMASGCHTLQQIDCSVCEAQYLGFRIVRTSDESERWKEGQYLLEMETLFSNQPTVDSILPRTPLSASMNLPLTPVRAVF